MSVDVEVRLITDGLKGKCLFATKNIRKGAVIFEEEPLVSCQFSWNAAYDYKACNHCLRPLESAEENARRLTGNSSLQLPYPECCKTDKSKVVRCQDCGEPYCSEECLLTASNQYHNTICLRTHERNLTHSLEQLNQTWKQVHYPPETNTIMLLIRLLARILQAPDRDIALQQTLQFCHRTVNEDAELAHKLLGEKFADQLSLLHSLFVSSIPNEGIEQFLTPEGFQSLLALIGTNGQGVGTSAIGVWANNVSNLTLPEGEKEVVEKFIDKLYEDMDSQSGTFLNNEGVALYTLQSTCNHSCTPNAEPSFLHNNHRLSLIATKDIREGEEICISYLDECVLNRSRHSRRKELMENYLFACICPKCEEEVDQSDVTSDEDEEMTDEES